MLKLDVFILRIKFLLVKDLRKIIALFIFIIVLGTTITVVFINSKLEKKNPAKIETIEISKDSTKHYSTVHRKKIHL